MNPYHIKEFEENMKILFKEKKIPMTASGLEAFRLGVEYAMTSRAMGLVPEMDTLCMGALEVIIAQRKEKLREINI